jgi:DNA invertase Pin-like site-specific DNA recombinase
MNDKLTAAHLERMAYVYIRQSTMYQVHNNLESKRRQYELKDRARSLGFRTVEVIDDDLGISGAGSKERPGFARLLAAVCEGKAGAVFAIEASRLARNNRDWHHLIDLCMLTGTLVVDADGIYDPRILNDRLLLGLKGTMSEFELGLLRQRAQEALRQKIARGEALWVLPIGYVRTETNGIEMSPDRQVQEAIRGVFHQFDRLGSVRQVLLWYRQEKILLCTLERGCNGKFALAWKLPCYHRILAILKNPTYAGAFAYGRRLTRSHIIEGRARKTAGHDVSLEDWRVLIRDHHPAYISWEQYMANQKRVTGNLAKHHAAACGAAKKGPALLAGLLRCARCGRKFYVAYGSGRYARYQCRGGHIVHGTLFCLAFGGHKVDQVIVQAVLDALQPVGIEAALRAAESFSQAQDQKAKALSLALEKARYEANRVRRQYDAVEPENRLVAAELEARWNTALEEVTKAERRLAETRSTTEPLSPEEKERLMRLGANLTELWDHPTTSMVLKKRLLRSIIEEITADSDDKTRELSFRIHWVGGVHTTLRMQRPGTGEHRHATDRAVVDLVRDLATVSKDAAIAGILNKLGYRTGVGNTWTEARVAGLRHNNKIAVFAEDEPRSWVTMNEAARELRVTSRVVEKLLKKKILPGKYIVRWAPWVIQREDLKLPQVQRYIAAVHQGKRPPRYDVNQTEMALS